MMNIRICVLLICGALVASATAYALTPPKIVRMASAQGEVLFHHEEHQAAVNGCRDCHHEGLDVPRCRDCHGVDRMIPRLKHAFHRQCRNCHIKDDGPTECNSCHKKSL